LCGIVKPLRDTGHSDVMVRINQPLELAVRIWKPPSSPV